MLYAAAAESTALAIPSDLLNIKPTWEAFSTAGTMANTVLGLLLAVAVAVCAGLLIAGIAKQRLGSTSGRNSYSSEEGKGLLVSGIAGLVIASLLMPIMDAAWVLPGL